MSTESLYLIIPIIYIFIGYLIAKFRGSKRRIGFGWTFFFSVFLSPIAGFLYTSLSPLLNKLPPDNPKDKVGNILLCILGCLGAIYSAGTEIEIAMMILSVIGPMGFVYYMATRSIRNKKAYEKFMLSTSGKTSLPMV